MFVVKRITFVMYSSVMIFFYADVWMNNVYKITLLSGIYWCLVFPIHMLYLIFSKFVTSLTYKKVLILYFIAKF